MWMLVSLKNYESIKLYILHFKFHTSLQFAIMICNFNVQLIWKIKSLIFIQLSNASLFHFLKMMAVKVLKLCLTILLILSKLSNGAELIKNPNSEGFFITGRGCGASSPFKFLNYIPDNLEEYECSFINLQTFVPYHLRIKTEIPDCSINDQFNNLIGSHEENVNGWNFDGIDRYSHYQNLIIN